MSLKYNCPLPTVITSLTAVTCAEHYGQITRIIFQRLGTSFPAASGVGGIELIASWTPLLIAADSTKVQASPICENVELPMSEAITDGGDDNSTPFGQSLVVGAGKVDLTGRHRGLPSVQKMELEQFVSESSVYGQLGVYLVNEHEQIICNNLVGTELSPFPITGYFISSTGSEGFNSHNFNKFQWAMKSNWSDYAKIETPTDFAPNTDL